MMPSADPGFNSPVLGLNLDHFFTRNTRATLTKTIPDGTYWWHVRGVASDGSVGPWSPARSFVKQWAEQAFQPTLLAPADNSDVTYPTDVFRLAWTPVPGAVKYLVSVATDPSHPVGANEEQRMALAFGDLTPVPPEACLRADRAFQAAAEYLQSGERPGWLEYHHAP